MRFLFDPSGERPGGIRLIAEIPDYRICHLEGRNGAGKSLALRLLELISGEQPYRTTPGAWSSLKENLGPTTITVSGLDSKTLKVDLKPQDWRPSSEPIGEWLGEAFLDETPIAIRSIGALLRVIRIAGDETFERTISRRLTAEAIAIERGQNRFEQYRSQLERSLDTLRDPLATIDLDQRDQQRLDTITTKLFEAEGRLRASQDELSLLDTALLARQRLTALSNQLPDIEARLAELGQGAKELGEQLRSAQDRQAALLAHLAGEPKVKQQMREERRKRDLRLRRLQRLTGEAQRAAAQLNVLPELLAVASAITEAKTERVRIQSDLTSAGHNASIRDFTSRVGKELETHRELDAEVIAVLDKSNHNVRLTASELRSGIQRRQVELTEIEDDPLLRELNLRNQDVSRRIARLTALSKSITAQERARELLSNSEDGLAAIVGRAQATDDLRAEYQQLAAEVTSTEEQLRLQLAEEVRLQVQADQLTAGKSQEELSEQLILALNRLELRHPTELDQQHQITRALAEESRDRVRQLRTEQIELQRSVARQATEAEQVSARLAAINWLPLSIKQALVRKSGHPNSDTLLALNQAVKNINRSLYLVRDQFDKLLDAARKLEGEVGRRDRIPNDTGLIIELAEAMGARLRNEFNQEEIRSALFDGGELRKIDLRNLEAEWITSNGETRSRPFEAFSSGEQVFAYTRARIEAVSTIEAKHKVIALDEFGAFLARDRLERLASYLRDAVGGSIADQVIIVVPLAANYKTQADVTSGELGHRFARRAIEIEQRLYFAEDATKRELV